MIVVVGSRSNFRKWADIRQSKVGKYLPKLKQYEKAVNVSSAKDVFKVLQFDRLTDLIILDKKRNLDIALIRKKIVVDSLIFRS